MNPSLSKSQFIRGLQCHKSLWLYKNNPELRPEPDEAIQSVFDSGTEVGELARGLFPGGELIEYEGSSIDEKLARTKALIEGGVKTIYEATFRFEGLLVMVDILHEGEGGWEIYEVKRSTEVKDVHLSDLSVQYYVLTGAGLPVSRACIVHINNKYIRQGDIDIRELFHIEDETGKVVSRQPFIGEEVIKMGDMLHDDCPAIDIGPQCSDPYPCDFISHCWAHIPENSLFDLRGKGINKFLSYKSGMLSFEDINPDDLNSKQRMQVDAELEGTVTIDREGIKAFLDSVRYPLCFLDFETFFDEAVPPFDGTGPYDKIPFQQSIHCIEKEGGEPIHHEFLAQAGEDGREEIARLLTEIIPVNACTVAYNMSFEKGVIATLAERFPAYKEKLLNINENMIDLMVPFRSRHYYTKAMKGSYSIKYVLPALVPELSYDGMPVSNGGEAALTYKNLLNVDDPLEVDKIRKDLLAYCGLDTLAMMKLLEKLKACLK